MKRFDLRPLKDMFIERMGEIIDNDLKSGEVGIFMFEIGEFANVAKSADFIAGRGDEIINSVRFNHVDWTLVIRKKND